MELKSYQRKVIENLEEYLGYVQEHKSLSTAFNQYWEDKIGAYNPLEGTGMEPYKTTFQMLLTFASKCQQLAEKPLLL